MRGVALWTKSDAKERSLLWPARFWPQGHTGRLCWSSPHALHHPRALSGAGTRQGPREAARIKGSAETLLWQLHRGTDVCGARARPHPWAPTGATVSDKGQGGGQEPGKPVLWLPMRTLLPSQAREAWGNSHYTGFILYLYSHH